MKQRKTKKEVKTTRGERNMRNWLHHHLNSPKEAEIFENLIDIDKLSKHQNRTTAGRPASVRTANNALASARNELDILDKIIAESDREIQESARNELDVHDEIIAESDREIQESARNELDVHDEIIAESDREIQESAENELDVLDEIIAVLDREIQESARNELDVLDEIIAVLDREIQESARNELDVHDEIIAESDREIQEFDEKLILDDLYEDHGKQINCTFKRASRVSDRCTELGKIIQEALTEYVQSSKALMQVPQTINSAFGASFISLPTGYSLRQFIKGELTTTEDEAQEKADRQQLAEEIGSQVRDLTKNSTTLTMEQANQLVNTVGLMQSWRRIINQFQKASDIVFARHSLIPTKPPEEERHVPVYHRPPQDKIMEERLKYRMVHELPTYEVEPACRVETKFVH